MSWVSTSLAIISLLRIDKPIRFLLRFRQHPSASLAFSLKTIIIGRVSWITISRLRLPWLYDTTSSLSFTTNSTFLKLILIRLILPSLNSANFRVCSRCLLLEVYLTSRYLGGQVPLLDFVDTLSRIEWSTHLIICVCRWRLVCFGISLTVTHRTCSVYLIRELIWTSSSVIESASIRAMLPLKVLTAVSSIAWFHLDHLAHFCRVKSLRYLLGLFHLILLTLRHWVT